MKFPSYVPTAVRELIVSMLDGVTGDGLKDFGWRDALASAKNELLRLEELQRTIQDPGGLDNLRVECAKQRAHIDGIGRNVECLERLALRPEMQQAYAKLIGSVGTDQELQAFIRAAWAADVNYAVFRRRQDQAAEICRQVADAASALHDVLRKAEGLGTTFPSEFFSARSLLLGTDHDPSDRNHQMWRGLRRGLLGVGDEQPKAAHEIGPIMPTFVETIPMRSGPDHSKNADHYMADYAWKTAPDVRHLLVTMRRAAIEWAPSETGAIGAALSSQKRNAKTEYVRGFLSLLRGDYRVELSPALFHAMAITATVVLNDSMTVVNYDDVRKLANLAAD